MGCHLSPKPLPKIIYCLTDLLAKIWKTIGVFNKEADLAKILHLAGYWGVSLAGVVGALVGVAIAIAGVLRQDAVDSIAQATPIGLQVHRQACCSETGLWCGLGRKGIEEVGAPACNTASIHTAIIACNAAAQEDETLA